MRAARPADAGAIARVHRESWRSTYGGILPLEFVARESGNKSEAQWRRGLVDKRPDSQTWIAESAHEGLIGFASCGEARDPIEGLDAEIYALYVLQSHHRRGVGHELVRACARHFVRQGLFGFYLWVLKANHARFFYEALGGEEIAAKSERLGLHRYPQVAYGWHDLTPLIAEP